MALRIVQFVAILLAAVGLVPAGAHLLELRRKITMSEHDYFVVQAIYQGWALSGIVLFAAILADLALVIMLRGQGTAFWTALLALIGAVALVAIFFVWTYPANVATANWTAVPANWQALRAQWEYSHAAAAIVSLAALCLLVISALSTRTA